MEMSRQQLAAVLSKVFIFDHLNDEELALLISNTELLYYPAEKMIYKQGGMAEAYYIVYEGRVEILQEKKQTLYYKNVINPIHAFGEDVLSTSPKRRTSARASEDTVLLKIDKASLLNAAASNHHFFLALQGQFASYNYLLNSRLEKFTDETLCFISRPHPIKVFTRMVLMLFLLVLSGILVLFIRDREIISARALGWLMGAFSIGGIGSLAWNYLEWVNDFFFFSNIRVSSTRRSLLIFEERQETPFSAIESVQTRRDLLGRSLGYGDLDINTYTGSTRIRHVPRVEQTRELLQNLVQLRRRSAQEKSIQTFRDDLQQRIRTGEQNLAQNTALHKPTQDLTVAENKTEQGSSEELIFHKHFTVLFSRIFIPLLLLLSNGLLYLFLWLNRIPVIVSDVFNGIMAGISLILLFWSFYRFLDWYNDRFIIAQGMLTDIDRRPFGTEEKRSAPIERIQSVRYKKKGAFGLLFNFGTVFIRIGDEEFTFDDLHRPAEITQIIFDAQEALLDQARSRQADADRRQALDWIETYHQLQTQEKNKNGENDAALS